ncbi:rhodanese-like domain-containing protein [Limibacillus halophilus]
MRSITAREAKERLQKALDGEKELAFLDVREAGQYGEGHPFFVVNLPYSRLELEAEALLPRKTVEILLLDEDDGVGDRAARRLAGLGYAQVSRIEGGVAGWEAAGYGLFKGVNLPSKAFGELVEAELHTPAIGPEELARRLASEKPPLLLDGRSPAEFAKMNIPGGRACANAELPHRLEALLDDPERPVVINCAGRTRSIIGAQGLINAGFSNPVFALENGTQGWELAGLTLERGGTPKPLPPLTQEQEEASRRRAESYRQSFAVPAVGLAELEAWQADRERSFYLFDVRSAEEFAAGHLPGARHAPGGQLVQATDQWVGVRGARILLSDDTGLRAAVTAAWLRGMGHDVSVLDLDVRQTAGPAVGIEKRTPPPLPAAVERVTVEEAAARVEAGVGLLDLSPSMTFRKGHPAGAQWAVRPRLPDPAAEGAVLVGADPALLALAASDLLEAGWRKLATAPREEAAWAAAGRPFESSPDSPSEEEAIDFLFFVHDRHDGNLESARAYLAWETGLLARMDASEKGALRPPRRTA